MSKPTYEQLEATVTNPESKVQGLAAENAYLLPKAASELLNAWVLNKYWVGIHVALMHFRAGRKRDGMVWLHNTIAGPGIEAPEFSEFAEIELWAVEQQKDSISAARALEIIKAEIPHTDAKLAEIRNEARAEGIFFTANRMLAAWDAGFIDSPAKEVIDVARMILSAADMLKDATMGDFSRKFADEIMAEMAPELRKEQGK